MDTNPKRAASTETSDSEELEQRIRQRAYELYLVRGHGDGHDVEDWLEAEEELTQESRSVAA
jgi:hypothetical protein